MSTTSFLSVKSLGNVKIGQSQGFRNGLNGVEGERKEEIQMINEAHMKEMRHFRKAFVGGWSKRAKVGTMMNHEFHFFPFLL